MRLIFVTVSVCSFVGALLATAPAQAGSYTFTALNLPGESGSMAFGINDSDQVVGEAGLFGDTGFTWSKGTRTEVADGPLLKINRSGVALGRGRSTVHYGYDTVFTYNANTGQEVVYNRDQRLSFIPRAINASGRIVGYVENPVTGDGGLGFDLFDNHVHYLAAPNTSAQYGTVALDINDTDHIVTAVNNLFYIYAHGIYTQINYPTSLTTVELWVNSKNVTGGWYFDSAHVTHGFTESDGVYTSYDIPGTDFVEVVGMTKKGVALGIQETKTHVSGRPVLTDMVFVKLPTETKYHVVGFPGAANTILTGVNSTGDIVGYFNMPNGPDQAFVAICAPSDRPCTQ